MTDAHDNDARETLSELLKDFRFAMLTTIDGDGKLLSHPLTVQEAEFDGDLWFILGNDSTAAASLRERPEVNVAFAGSTSWVSLAATARLVEDRAKLEELWDKSTDAWFEGGIDDPRVGLLHVTAHSAEYWHSKGGTVTRVAAALSGKRVPGESETVEL